MRFSKNLSIKYFPPMRYIFPFNKIASYFIPLTVIALIGLWKPAYLIPVIALWVAISCFCVALSYSLNWAFLLRKKSDGSIPPYIRWLFVPYLIYVQVYNGIKRLVDEAPLFSKITDRLYVGARLNPVNIEELKEHNINCVLDMTAEFDGLGSFVFDSDIEYLNIPVLDHSVPKPFQLSKALRWIHKNRTQGKGVLVHCAMGRGRSVFIIAAYLMTIGMANSAEEAVQKIRKIRSTAKLNRYQLRKFKSMMKKGVTLLKDKAVIVANPVSGGGKWGEYKEEVLEYLSPYFHITLLETTKDTSAKELLQQTDLNCVHTVIACGGDGTVNEVSSVLADTDIKLGILPLGTANSLCQVLVGFHSKFMPVNAACSAVIKGRTQKIDLAQCNNETMMLALGVGFEQQMIEYASRENKNAMGQMAYIYGFLRAINNNEHQYLRIKIDDEEEQEIRTNSLMIANAAPSSTILAQGNGNPAFDDGHLDLTWFEGHESVNDNIRTLSNLVLAVINGTQSDSQVKHRHINKIEIRSDSEIPYVIDGENRRADKLEISIRPKCLNVYIDPDDEFNHAQLAAKVFG